MRVRIAPGTQAWSGHLIYVMGQANPTGQASTETNNREKEVMTATTTTPASTDLGIKEGATFRPWGIDALATITKAGPSGVTIAYDHDPAREYTLSRRDLAVIGRIVHRANFA